MENKKKPKKKITKKSKIFASLASGHCIERSRFKKFQLFPDDPAYAEGFGPTPKLVQFLQKPASPMALGVVSLLIAASLMLFPSLLIAQKQKINSVAIIETASTIKNVDIVADGSSIKWTKLVKVSDIKSGDYLLNLPKKSKNIKISTITAQQAKNILSSKPSEQLSLSQRVKIAKANQPKSFLLASLVNSIRNSLTADLESAVDNTIQAITQSQDTDIIPTPDVTVVDLSTEIQPDTSSSAVITPTVDVPTAQVIVTSQSVDTSILDTDIVTAQALLMHANIGTGVEDYTQQAVDTLQSVIDSTLAIENKSDVIQSEIDSADSSLKNAVITFQASNQFVKVDYETSAPVITEQKTDTGKEVTVSSVDETSAAPLTDVLASTKIPEIYKVGEENKIHIKWKNNGNQNVAFAAYDTDGNGKLDYVEWTVPHLSEQVFEIIFISKAFQLDESQNIVADIYDTVQSQDGNYATVPQNNYIRSTFEHPLNSENDITLYARPTISGQSSSIEVYPVYQDADGNMNEGPKLDLVSDNINPNFSNINQNGKYRVLLKNLQTSTDIFDLKIIGASTDIDYIVDPAPNDVYWVGGTGNWSQASTHWASVSGGTPDAGNLPGTNSNVHFDSNSGTGTVYMDVSNVSVVNFDESSLNILPHFNVAGITITGDMTVNNYTTSNDGGVTFGGSNQTITFGSGASIQSAPIVLNADVTVLVASGTSGLSAPITGTHRLIKTGAGRLNMPYTFAANSFNGGLIIKAGTVYTAATNGLGASNNIVTLGDSVANNSNATLIVASNTNVPQPIVLADIANATGIMTITGDNNASSAQIIGGVTGNNNLTLGGIGSSEIDFITNPINNSGKIINAAVDSPNYIKGGVGTNVTEIINNSTSSGLSIITNPINVGASGIILTNAVGPYAVTVTGGVTGTGNLTLKNNSAVAPGINFTTTAINNVGAIINSGSGSGRVTIAGGVGSNVTGINQNSSTSALNVAGANTFVGPITNSAGTLNLNQSATYSTLTLGADTTTTFMSGGTFTLTNIISNGAVGHLATINSSSSGSPSTLTTSSPRILADYLSIKDSNPTQTNAWYAGNHSTSVSDTGNWLFVSPAPLVSGVTSSAANGFYHAGQVIPVQINFSGTVIVSGTPQIILSTGSPATTAVNYSSGSGTSTLEFDYTVGDGNISSALDYASTTALILNGGTIKDVVGSDATLTLASPGATNSLSANKQLVIDTTNPTTSISSPSDNSYSISATVNLTGTSSDANLSKTEISVDGGSFTATTGTASSWTYSATSLSQGAHTFVSKATDLAGNTTTSSTIHVTVDTIIPTVTINQAAGQTDPTNNSVINFTVIFSEAINPSTFTSSDITTGGTAGSVVWSTPTTSDNITWNIATSSIGSGGTVMPSLLANKVTDVAGNNNAASTSTDNSVLYDATPAVITSVTSYIDNGIYKIGQAIPIQISFSKNVVVTGTPQLTLETGAIDRTINYVSGTGSATLTFSYTVQAGDNSSDLDYISTSALALNGGTVKDAAGNNATLTLASPGATNSLSANKQLVIDTTNPTTSISSPSDNSYSISATVNLTGTSSDANLSKTEISVDGGSFTATTGTASSWTYSATSLSQGAHTFVSKATDLAGNTTTSSTIHVTVDTIAPIVSITSPLTSAKVNGNAVMSFTDTETTNPMCSFDNSTWSGCTTLNAITGWSSLTEGSTFTLYLQDTDMAGNVGTTNTAGIIKDTTGPTVTEVTPIGTTTENSINYTFNSTEAGTINYGGSCLSGSISAIEGHNSIIFNTLAVGDYSDCTITVTDSAGNISTPLSISSFTVTNAGSSTVASGGGGGGGGGSGSPNSGRYLSQDAINYIIQTLNQIKQSIYDLFGSGASSTIKTGDNLNSSATSATPGTTQSVTKTNQIVIDIYQKIVNAISSLVSLFIK